MLDIAMPQKSGLDIVVELKNDKDTRRIPFIFVTAMINPKEAEKREDIAGRERYISKPVNIEELISIISELGTARQETKERITAVTFFSITRLISRIN